MEPELSSGGVDRRELLKKGAIAGGLVWASPMVFSGIAGAQTTVGACTNCPSTRLFGIKYNNGSGLESLPKPNPNNPNAGQGNCLSATAEAPTSCFSQYFTGPTGSSTTHVWVLQPALQLCQVAAKVGQGTTGGEGCFPCAPTATNPTVCTVGTAGSITISVANGVTTVTVTDAALSHSEILFCYRGSPNSCVGAL